MPEQPQTLNGCMANQKECQTKIFNHIDDRHDKVMNELGVIQTALAYEKGVRNGAAATATGKNAPVKSDKVNWNKVAAAAVVVATAIFSLGVTYRTIFGGESTRTPSELQPSPPPVRSNP